MNNKFKRIIISTALLITGISNAQSVDLKLLKESASSVDESSLKSTPVSGLFSIQANGQLLYITADGTKIITGEMIDLKIKKNLTREIQQKIGAKSLSQIKEEDKIIYKAMNEKYIVHVFTDVTCPWCKKLHEQIAQYNDLGITIKFLAYPRAGGDSEVSLAMQSVWCAKDKPKALDDAELRHKIPQETCNGTAVKEQFEIGVSMGVNGTPAIVLSSGEILGGYLPPEDLIQELRK